MQARFDFTGTGRELFPKLVAGALLTGATFGLYAPWMVVDLARFTAGRTRLLRPGHSGGDLRFEVTATGAELFAAGLLGGIATVLSFGLLGPWWIARLARFWVEHTAAIAADGARYELRLNLSGAELLATLFAGGALTLLTLGLYAPWYLCRVAQLFAEKTELVRDRRYLGRIELTGTGGALAWILLRGAALSIATLGLYLPWLEIRVLSFAAEGTRLVIGGREWAGAFEASGALRLAQLLGGALLILLTLGFYVPWLVVTELRFRANHLAFGEVHAPRDL